MAVTGWGHVHVAVLVGGNTPIWHRVDREPTLETYLIGEAEQLWQAHLDGVPPQVDASAALARLYEALYTQRAGARTIPTGQAADLYQRYAEGKRLENEGKAQVAAARAEAIAVLDDAEDLCVDGRVKPLATFRRGEDQTALPVEQLRRLAGVHPRIYARLVKEGFIVTTTPARVLRWAKRVGQTLVDVDE
jgi:predicted phage-related endonuclease